MADLKEIIEKAFDDRDNVNYDTKGEIRDAVEEALNQLDSGTLRVAEKQNGDWVVNQWAKKAVLLSFRLNDMELMGNAPSTGGVQANWYDKVPSKFLGWGEEEFKKAAFRAVPGSGCPYPGCR